MTVKEAFALFKEENPDVIIKSSKFYELWLKNVLLSSEMPHNVCVCKYHANFNFLVEAIHKKVSSFPVNHADLLNLVCCDIESEKCMTNECDKCIMNLHIKIDGEVDTSEIVQWKQWTEDDCRPKFIVSDGTIDEALTELQAQLKKFKEHYFVKRLQSATFKDMKTSVNDDEVILQIDFVENYLALTQDEIQSAHWSHKQITVINYCLLYTSRCV